MTAFGPSVETSTFIVFAPVAARELADRLGRPRWARVAAWGGAVLFLVTIVAPFLPRAVHRPVIALGVQPLGAVLLAVSAVARVMAARPEVPAALLTADPAPEPRAKAAGARLTSRP